MKRFVEKRGFKSAGYRDLGVAALLKMAPAIVPTRLDGLDHFVVVRAGANGKLLLADPNYGNRIVAVDEFMKHWDGIAFVVRRPK
jgi:predicted double-glycine peptidase